MDSIHHLNQPIMLKKINSLYWTNYHSVLFVQGVALLVSGILWIFDYPVIAFWGLMFVSAGAGMMYEVIKEPPRKLLVGNRLLYQSLFIFATSMVASGILIDNLWGHRIPTLYALFFSLFLSICTPAFLGSRFINWARRSRYSRLLWH